MPAGCAAACCWPAAQLQLQYAGDTEEPLLLLLLLYDQGTERSATRQQPVLLTWIAATSSCGVCVWGGGRGCGVERQVILLCMHLGGCRGLSSLPGGAVKTCC